MVSMACCVGLVADQMLHCTIYRLGVFKHAKIAICDISVMLTTLKRRQNCYMHWMTKYIGKISRWNSKRSLRKLQKKSYWVLFAAPCMYGQHSHRTRATCMMCWRWRIYVIVSAALDLLSGGRGSILTCSCTVVLRPIECDPRLNSSHHTHFHFVTDNSKQWKVNRLTTM